MVLSARTAQQTRKIQVVSIFDRLISTLTGGEEPKPAAPAQAANTEPTDSKPRRFMGRDGVESGDLPTAAAAPVEAGLEQGAEIWVYIQPATQRLLLVPELGVAEGKEFTPKMMADLKRLGWCEAVAYHAGYDQYWKMPSQEAILRTPSLHHIPTPLLNRMRLETKLVKQGEPRGFWMHVRVRTPEELPEQEEPVV